MKAGRELDALVAEKVMGCTLKAGGDPRTDDPWLCGCEDEAHREDNEYDVRTYIKPYSSSIAAAWEVMDILKDGFATSYYTAEEGWTFVFRGQAATAGTAPLAICMAALKAKVVSVD